MSCEKCDTLQPCTVCGVVYNTDYSPVCPVCRLESNLGYDLRDIKEDLSILEKKSN